MLACRCRPSFFLRWVMRVMVDFGFLLLRFGRCFRSGLPAAHSRDHTLQALHIIMHLLASSVPSHVIVMVANLFTELAQLSGILGCKNSSSPTRNGFGFPGNPKRSQPS